MKTMIAFLVFFLCSANVFANDPSGSWTIKAGFGGNNTGSMMIYNVNGNGFRGEMTTSLGEDTFIRKGKTTNSGISFTRIIPNVGSQIWIGSFINNDRLEGDWSGEGGSGVWYATRN